MVEREVTTRCCIAGGGPAGMMLGLLLARAGVDVLVLEKHADFLRDFRGDTIHPSTLEVIDELGLLDDLLKLPHQEARQLSAQIGPERVQIADFGHLPARHAFIVFMPQWDFLAFLGERAARFPGFRLRMATEVTGLVVDASGRVTGIHARTPDGTLDVHAALVVGADGRNSTVRASAGLAVEELGAPMDVLWFRLPRRHDDPGEPMGYFESGQILIVVNRGEYYQCGLVIAKGSFDELRARGLERFRARIAAAVPFLAEAVSTLADWQSVRLLTVRVDRLREWYRPGLLCLGDAAHAMSPIAGVGINLAIQDAVAAANLLAEPLRHDQLRTSHLRRVQRRRELPTRMTQRAQILLQDRVISPALGGSDRLRVPLPIRLLARFPRLRQLPARLIGVGVRPEHVETRAVRGATGGG